MKQLVIYKKGETHLQTTITNGYCDYTDGKRPEAYLDELGSGFVCIPYDQAEKLITQAENEKYLNKPWKEIDEDMWDYWLGVLPPEKWGTVDGVNIFRICERLIGNITKHCARYDGRFFQADRRTTESYNFMAAQIKIICKSFPKTKELKQ